MKIAYIEKTNLVRKAFTNLLEKIEGVEVIIEVGSIGESFKLCKKKKPEVILVGEVDIGMLNMPVSEIIKREMPDVKVLLITDESKKDDMLEELSAGADGYILKNWSEEELRNALQHFKEEGIIIPRKKTVALAKEIKIKQPLSKRNITLTIMEFKIMRLVCDGLNNKGIAGKLGISGSTVRNHLHTAFTKLNVKSRSEAAIEIFKRAGIKLPAEIVKKHK